MNSVHTQGHCTAKCYHRFRLAASESRFWNLQRHLNVTLLKADSVNISTPRRTLFGGWGVSWRDDCVKGRGDIHLAIPWPPPAYIRQCSIWFRDLENSVKQTFKTNLALFFLFLSKLSLKDPPQTSESPLTNLYISIYIDTFSYVLCDLCVTQHAFISLIL